MELNQDILKIMLAELVLTKNYGFTVDKKSSLEDDCAICMETMKDKIVVNIPCGHSYHYECIMECIVEYKFTKCPECSSKEDDFKFIQDNSILYSKLFSEVKSDYESNGVLNGESDAGSDAGPVGSDGESDGGSCSKSDGGSVVELDNGYDIKNNDSNSETSDTPTIDCNSLQLTIYNSNEYDEYGLC